MRRWGTVDLFPCTLSKSSACTSAHPHSNAPPSPTPVHLYYRAEIALNLSFAVPKPKNALEELISSEVAYIDSLKEDRHACLSVGCSQQHD